MRHSILKTFLLFVGLGPLVGGAAVILAWTAEGSGVRAMNGALRLLPLWYLFGVGPAFLTAVVAWYFRAQLDRLPGAIVTCVVGALSTVAVWTLFDDWSRGPLSWDTFALRGLLPGGVAGAMCGLGYFGRSPSTSLERTRER
jgi:hypothetical protein